MSKTKEISNKLDCRTPFGTAVAGVLAVGIAGMAVLAPSAQDVAYEPVPDTYDDYITASKPVVPITVAFCRVGSDGHIDVIDVTHKTIQASTLGEKNIKADDQNKWCTYQEPGRPVITLQMQ